MLISSLTSRFSGRGRQLRRKLTKGFTLIELLVVSLIIIVITGFILLRQSSFDSTTLLRSLAYSFALSVRQAQIFGTSVRESSPGSGIFDANYGISLSSGSPDNYIMFADVNRNGQYDTPPTDALVKQFSVGQGYRINQLCGVSTVSPTTCTALTELRIYFARPNPEALYSTVPSGTYSRVLVQFSPGSGLETRAVKISSTGQIAVCATNLVDLTTC